VKLSVEILNALETLYWKDENGSHDKARKILRNYTGTYDPREKLDAPLKPHDQEHEASSET
jgi:precorrin-2 methylase